MIDTRLSGVPTSNEIFLHRATAVGRGRAKPPDRQIRCSQCGCRLKALGAKRVVPQSAEPFFHVCITRRFSPGRKLQSAAAPRTPQALGQHFECRGRPRAHDAARLRTGRARRPPARRPESRRRAAENRTAHDARRRGAADATSRITQPSTTQPRWTTR